MSKRGGSMDRSLTYVRQATSMRRIVPFLKRLAVDSRAATALEYGLIIALVVLALFGALRATATSTLAMWNMVSTKVAEH